MSIRATSPPEAGIEDDKRTKTVLSRSIGTPPVLDDSLNWSVRIQERQQRILEQLSFDKSKSLSLDTRADVRPNTFQRAASENVAIRRVELEPVRTASRSSVPGLRLLSDALAYSDVEQQTTKLTMKADEAEGLLESARRELEMIEEECSDLKPRQFDVDGDDELSKAIQNLRQRSQVSYQKHNNTSDNDAKQSLMRSELMKMKLSLLKDSQYNSHNETRPDSHLSSGLDRGGSAQSVSTQALSVVSSNERSFTMSSSIMLSSVASTPRSPNPNPGPTTGSSSLLFDLMSNFRPVTPAAPPVDLGDLSGHEVKLLTNKLSKLRSLGPCPSGWPDQVSRLYAKLNCCLSYPSWQDLVQIFEEGLQLSYNGQPAITFICCYGDVMCVLLTTYSPESICSLIWKNLVRKTADAIRKSRTNSSQMNPELDTMETQLRSLFDDNFVETVLDNLIDVGLRRRVQSLIASLAGMVFQRASIISQNWDSKFEAVLHKADLSNDESSTLSIEEQFKVWLWTNEQVDDWLNYHNLSEYTLPFRQRDIDGYKLLNLTQSEIDSIESEIRNWSLAPHTPNILCFTNDPNGEEFTIETTPKNYEIPSLSIHPVQPKLGSCRAIIVSPNSSHEETAKSLNKQLTDRGYQTNLLINNESTYEAVKDAILKTINNVQDGDRALFWYLGSANEVEDDDGKPFWSVDLFNGDSLVWSDLSVLLGCFKQGSKRQLSIFF